LASRGLNKEVRRRFLRSHLQPSVNTTGKPKGVVHTTGGYAVQTYLTTKWIFDLKEEDTYWHTADIGWFTGHSYIVYARRKTEPPA
jgi:hypothetical protein